MSMLRVLLALAGISSAAAFSRDDQRITGLMVAVYTPMKNGGLELDLDRIPAYAEYLVKLNISNVMPAGSNGESLSLSVAERKALAEAWAAAALKTSLRVYMHIGSESLVDSIELAKHASKTEGIRGILAMTPVYFKPTVQSLHDFLAAIANAVPEMPFWFYHFPDDTGVLPGGAHKFLELADKSGQMPNLMGIKFTDYNLMDFQDCLQVGHYKKYNMLFGRDEMAFAALGVGADAAVSSTAQFSATLRDVISAFAKGDMEKAKKAQFLNGNMCSTFGAFEGDINVQKNIMKMVGMDVGPSRLPKRDFTADEYSKYEKELVSAGYIDIKADSFMPVVQV
eukprot:TRINITY_DN47683_c0_g1_i1.p1 TRINITY_DN47683_c0_g1~~TRINITY_DN47683_c0_g1_i1.p1  ORF type:complete len:361 (-),score=98.59 TRINITY_DN47683_c0_g1_i1:381-1397(-)